MKPFIILSLALLTSFSALRAAESNDTIVDVTSADRVILTEGDGNMHLDILGRAGDPSYAFRYSQVKYRDTQTLLTEDTGKWDFDFGGITKPKCSTAHNDVYVGGLFFGFVTAPDAPEGMDVDMASSYEIGFDIIGVEHYFKNKKHSLSLGLGADWRNYRLKDKTRFVKDGDNIALGDYPEGASVDFSRIKVFSLTVPVRYHWYFAKDFSFDAGAIVNFNTYASVKTRYKLDGYKQKDLSKKLHQRPVTVDLQTGVAWKNIGIYAKYSPFDVLNDAYGLTFKSFSVGVTLFY